MKDFEWREMNDENLDLLAKYPSNPVIVQTEIVSRLAYARNICTVTHELMTANERVLRFAFFEE